MRTRRLSIILCPIVPLMAACGTGAPLPRLPVAAASATSGAAGGAVRDSAMAPMFGPVEYRVAGTLAALPASAPAYKLTGTAVDDGTVQKLAAALDMKGARHRSASSVSVADGDRQLTVMLDGGAAHWSLFRGCGAPATDPSGATGGITGEPMVGCAVAGSAVASGGAGATTATTMARSTRAVGSAAPTSGPAPTPGGTAPGGSGGSGGASGSPVDSKPPQVVGGPGTVVTCIEPGIGAMGQFVTGEPSASPGQPNSSGPATSPPSGSNGGGSATPPPSASDGSTTPAPPNGTPAVPSDQASCPVPVRPADLPSKDEAQRIALRVLKAAGLDATGAVRVDDQFSSWQVSVDPVVHGLPTLGMTTTLAVGPKGAIVSGWGTLATPEELGSYPLAGTTAGLERLRQGASIGPRPMMSDDARATVGPTPDIHTNPQTPIVLTITGVHLALQLLVARLVPVYLFELAGGETAAPVPAVVDRLLETPAVPKPQPVPAGKVVPPQPVPPTRVAPTPKPAQPLAP